MQMILDCVARLGLVSSDICILTVYFVIWSVGRWTSKCIPQSPGTIEKIGIDRFIEAGFKTTEQQPHIPDRFQKLLNDIATDQAQQTEGNSVFVILMELFLNPNVNQQDRRSARTLRTAARSGQRSKRQRVWKLIKRSGISYQRQQSHTRRRSSSCGMWMWSTRSTQRIMSPDRCPCPPKMHKSQSLKGKT